MSTASRSGQNRSPGRLAPGPLAAFLLLAGVIAALGYFYLQNQLAISRQAARRELSAIADLKVGQISNWYRERRGDAESAFANLMIQKRAQHVLTDADPEQASRELLSWLEGLQVNQDYSHLALIDHQGQVRLCTLKSQVALHEADLITLRTALRARGVVATDLHLGQTPEGAASPEIDLAFWVPVGGQDQDGQTALGALLLQVNPQRFIFPLIQGWPIPSQTAETLLVRREGDQAVYLNDLRHRPDTALSLRLPLDRQSDLPAARAVLGEEGVVEGRDYRGVPVLAALRRVPGTDWFLVAKEDQEEVFAPARQRAWAIGITVLAVILAAGLGVGLFWRRRDNQWLKSQLAHEHERQVLSERIVLLNKQAKDIILLTDQDWRILEANDSALQTYGYSLDQMRALRATDLRAPKAREEFARQVGNLTLEEGAVYETLHERKDGSVFPVEITLSEALLGSRSHYLAIIRDISQRKAAEASLRASEEKFKLVADYIHDWEYWLGPNRQLIFVSPSCLRITGHAPSEFQADPALIDRLTHPNDQALYQGHIEEHSPGEKSLQPGAPLEYRIITRQGQVRWLRHRCFPVHGADGRFLGRRVSSVDITYRKLAEEERKAHIRFLESLELIDQAIKQAEQVDQMLRKTLEVVFEIFACDRVWLLHPLDPDAPSFRVPMEITRPEYPGAMALDLDVPMTAAQAQHIREALESDGPVAFTAGTERDISTDEQFGVLAQMFVPLFPKTGKPWALGMHQCSYPRVWTEEEKKLFNEIGRRISDGLSSLLFLRDLQENEERFRAIFEQATVGISMVDPDGKWARVNQKFCDIVGYSREELLGENFQKLTHPDDLEADQENNRRVQAGKIQSYSGEKRYLRKDGSIVWVDLTGSLVHLAPGQPGYFLCVVVDTTMRKRAEDALRDSESRYRVLFQSSPDGILIADPQTTGFVVANPAICRMLGYEEHEFAHLRVADIHPPEIMPQVISLFQAMARGELTTAPSLPCLKKDGGRLIADIAGALVTLGDKQYLVGFFRDVTAHWEAEEGLRASEAKFSQVFAHAPLIITLSTIEDGILVDVNEEFVRVSGLAREEALGRGMVELGWLAPKDRPLIVEPVQRDGRVIGLELRVLSKQGQPVDILYHGEVIAIGGRRLLLSTAVDISDRKRAEEEKAALEAQLRQAHKMEAIGTLAGGIAHDFNNILAAILGFTELARAHVPPEGSVGEDLDEVIKASLRARDLVRQILTFSRSTDQDRQPLSLTPMVKEALKFLRATIPANIEIHQHFPATDGMVMADPTHIHQVIMNLGTNAAHAMGEKGGLLEVSLEEVELDERDTAIDPGLQPGPYLRLTVGDNGHGMDAQIMARMFDPFFTTKKVGEGTGMGLSVVHGIVKEMGGSIKVDSRPEAGTTVEMLLPRLAGEALEVASPSVPWPTGRERLLLVDDEAALLKVGEMLFSDLGYFVSTVTGGLEALDLLGQGAPEYDLVITDFSMPGMNGLDLAKAIRELRPELPIIICTGRSDRLSAEELRRTGIAAVLNKPSQGGEMARVVREVLDGRGRG